MRNLRSKALATRCLLVATAQKGSRSCASADRVDVLFTDVVLPGGVNGRRLADEAVRLRPRLPVLYTTGYTRNAIVHDGRLDPDVQTDLETVHAGRPCPLATPDHRRQQAPGLIPAMPSPASHDGPPALSERSKIGDRTGPSRFQVREGPPKPFHRARP